MEHLDLGGLIRLLLVAGGPLHLPARTTWPLEKALRWRAAEAGRSGSLGAAQRIVETQPSPDSGIGVVGIGVTVWQLRRERVLVPVGHGRDAGLEVDWERLRDDRRVLMRLDPRDADLLHHAARRWARWNGPLVRVGETAAELRSAAP